MTAKILVSTRESRGTLRGAWGRGCTVEILRRGWRTIYGWRPDIAGHQPLPRLFNTPYIHSGASFEIQLSACSFVIIMRSRV